MLEVHKRLFARRKLAITRILPATYAQVVEKTDMDLQSARRTIREMRRLGLCHIGDWQRAIVRGKFSPIIHAGPGEDVKCELVALTDLEYSRNYRARVKGTDAGDRRLAKDRNRYWKNKAITVGDPLVFALFGPRRAASSEVVSHD